MNLKKITKLLIQVLIFTAGMDSVFADDVAVIGSIQHSLKSPSRESSTRHQTIQNAKVIQLLRIQVSDEAKELLAARAKDATKHIRQFSVNSTRSESSTLPNQVQINMNKVPVLDQGIHGTCVTFAVTGALDAVIGKGDYVSQLCNLQLGSYLEQHGYGLSGWEGSYAINVINQIEQFGIINIEKQKKLGCGGMNYYPTTSYRNPKTFMEPEQYRSRSELIFGTVVNWSDVFQKTDPTKTLNEVKESLHSGDRLVFAVLLPRIDLGTAGAVGKYKTWISKDTWVLTPQILNGINNIEAAHEMIITGYNDDAVAVDNNGQKHKGLLTLRNSWGSSFGDDGEFYMSYDYFKLLSYDLTRFSKANLNF